jgi:hypothetical protein
MRIEQVIEGLSEYLRTPGGFLSAPVRAWPTNHHQTLNKPAVVARLLSSTQSRSAFP